MEQTDEQSRIAELQVRSGQLIEQSGRMPKLVDDAGAEKASDLRKLLKTERKRIDDDRKVFVKPLNETVKRINERYKTLTTALDEADTIVRRELSRYLNAKEQRERDEAQRLANEASERALKQAQEAEERAEAASDDHEASVSRVERDIALDDATAAFESVPERFAPVRGGTVGSTTSLVRKTTWVITNRAAIPARYLIVDEAALNKLARGKVEQRPLIPGIEFTDTKEAATR